ncbi:serine/threonine-protein phosphatase 7 long form homolog [Primulina eburnea]|uniref:serine/threonine-protein phosphatase 7 long form homolog n=1 Tax=Primulina eburnea TaxID=1245227 RepID=UPI003C6BD96D
MSRTDEEWQQKCVELLGFAPTASLVSGGRLSMVVLDAQCRENHIENDSSDLEVVQYTRCIALMVIGGCMFPYSRGGGVSLMYLQLLHNIPRVWAWSRMTSLSPDVHGFCHIVPAPPDVNDNNYDTILPIAPYGAMWARHFSHTHTSTHSVRIIREILDLMKDGQFNWTVYDFEALDVQAFIKGHQGEIWRCVCPLICFDIVEMYRPNRVLRQFGMRQRIPEPATDGDDLHNLSPTGHRNFDWKEFHSGPIEIWKNKEKHIADDMLVSGLVDYQYKKWYNNITIRFISPKSEGVGYSSGQACFRAMWLDEEATTHINRFGGLNVHEQSREALEEAIQDDWRIRRHLRDALNRVSNEKEVQHDIPRRNSFQNREECSRRRRRESGSTSSFDSHQHRTPHGFDVPGTSYDVASSVSLTELLNSDHRQFDNEVRSFYHEMRPNYLSSPIPFHGFSATSSGFAPDNLNRDRNTEIHHNTEMETEYFNLRRSVRVRIPRGCGTCHFYYY